MFGMEDNDFGSWRGLILEAGWLSCREISSVEEGNIGETLKSLTLLISAVVSTPVSVCMSATGAKHRETDVVKGI